MNDNIEFISIREASRLTGICPQTLRKLSDQNKVISYKTESGQRKFNKQDLEKMCKIDRKERDLLYKKPSGNFSPFLSIAPHSPKLQPQPMPLARKNFIYARVSSVSQHEDVINQINQIKAANDSYASYTEIVDISNGINFKRKGLSVILDACLDKCIGEVVTTHKDRICRIAFDLIQHLIEKAGGKITVVEADKLERAQIEKELSDDFLNIARVYAKRAS